jgi:hypothetical protein
MAETLRALTCERKKGSERFLGVDSKPTPSLLEFWQWAYSDLVGNVNRGRLAEFIVAIAIGKGLDQNDVRREWDAYDLVTASGLKIEVKSAAYIQSWCQKKLSIISFSAAPHRGFDFETSEFEKTARRHANVYVFALLKHKEKVTIDPMDLTQWEFYVLPTTLLDSAFPEGQPITLDMLRTHSVNSVQFKELRFAIENAINPVVDREISVDETIVPR